MHYSAQLQFPCTHSCITMGKGGCYARMMLELTDVKVVGEYLFTQSIGFDLYFARPYGVFNALCTRCKNNNHRRTLTRSHKHTHASI